MHTNTEPILLEWKAPKKIAHERSETWYIIMAVGCGTMIVYGILTSAWSLSICFGMLAGLFFLIRNEDPQVYSIVLKETGIEYDGRHRIWSDWKQFWILRGEDYHELHIESKRHLVPDLVIQTGDIDPYVIRDALAKYIPQIDTKKEKVLDAIIRFCKL